MLRKWLSYGRVLGAALALSLPSATHAEELMAVPAEAGDQDSDYYAGETSGDTVGADSKTETIQERFASGAVKVERQVVQDAAGNYVNHGLWSQFDEKGRLVARGEYTWGQRDGAWSRIHLPTGKDLYSQPEYKAFQAPFVSEATFDHGQLHGTWTVYDARNRKASEFAFERGRRHGKSIWLQPYGKKRREEAYEQDHLDGERVEWNEKDQVTSRRMFKQGRELAKKTKLYRPGQSQTEAIYLFARKTAEIDYDWWNGAIVEKVTGKDGADQRHGPFVAWYPNGQKKLEGQYQDDKPVGKFVWWYDNGQKAIEGEYVVGQQTGTWAWWHANGQKALQGAYQSGAEFGKWTWWKQDGQVSNAMQFSEQDGDTAVASITPLTPELGNVPTLQPAPVKDTTTTASARKTRRTR